MSSATEAATAATSAADADRLEELLREDDQREHGRGHGERAETTVRRAVDIVTLTIVYVGSAPSSSRKRDTRNSA